MDETNVSVRRTTLDGYETQLEALLREYHEFVAAEFVRWLIPEGESVEQDSFDGLPGLSPESYVDGELATDLAYLRDPAVDRPLVLALDDDAVVGCVYLYGLASESAEVKRLYVTETYRGRGLGAALMERLVAVATDAGLSTLRLDTAPFMDDALALYHDLGFVEYEGGTSISDIPAPMLDDITYMRMDLQADS